MLLLSFLYETPQTKKPQVQNLTLTSHLKSSQKMPDLPWNPQGNLILQANQEMFMLWKQEIPQLSGWNQKLKAKADFKEKRSIEAARKGTQTEGNFWFGCCWWNASLLDETGKQHIRVWRNTSEKERIVVGLIPWKHHQDDGGQGNGEEIPVRGASGKRRKDLQLLFVDGRVRRECFEGNRGDNSRKRVTDLNYQLKYYINIVRNTYNFIWTAKMSLYNPYADYLSITQNQEPPSNILLL